MKYIVSLLLFVFSMLILANSKVETFPEPKYHPGKIWTDIEPYIISEENFIRIFSLLNKAECAECNWLDYFPDNVLIPNNYVQLLKSYNVDTSAAVNGLYINHRIIDNSIYLVFNTQKVENSTLIYGLGYVYNKRDIVYQDSMRFLNNEQAMGLFRNFLLTKRTNFLQLSNCHISNRSFKYYRIFKIRDQCVMPPIIHYYVMNNESGYVEEYKIEHWKNICNPFCGPFQNDSLKQAIAYKIIKWDNRVNEIIHVYSDIYRYKVNRMEPDLELLINPPTFYDLGDGHISYIVYTYEHVGGVVRRFRFEFDEDGYFENVQAYIIARKIGDSSWTF